MEIIPIKHKQFIGVSGVILLALFFWSVYYLITSNNNQEPTLVEQNDVAQLKSDFFNSKESDVSTVVERSLLIDEILLHDTEMSNYEKSEWMARKALNNLVLRDATLESFSRAIDSGLKPLAQILTATDGGVSPLAKSMAIAGFQKMYFTTSYSYEVFAQVPPEYRVSQYASNDLNEILTFYRLGMTSPVDNDLTVNALSAFYAAVALHSFGEILTTEDAENLYSEIESTFRYIDTLRSITYRTRESGELFSNFHLAYAYDILNSREGLQNQDTNALIDSKYENLILEFSEESEDSETLAFIKFFTSVYYSESLRRRYSNDLSREGLAAAEKRIVELFLKVVEEESRFAYSFRFYFFDTFLTSYWDAVRTGFVSLADSNSELMQYLNSIGITQEQAKRIKK